MKKIFFLILLLVVIFVSSSYSEDCICYYFNYDSFDSPMFKKTCEYYNEVIKKTLGVVCSIKPYSYHLYLPQDRKIAIIFSGHGNPKGLYLTHPEEISEDYNNAVIYSWEDLVHDLDALIVIIDACFSGYAQDYFHPTIDFLITSTYKENSWNVLDPYSGDNTLVSALAISLRCKYDYEYHCPYNVPIFGNCPNMSINECQLKLIVDAICRSNIPDFYDWETPSIGTCVLNNKPCSYYLK